MSIFNTIGRLTYKTQRVVTRSMADPVKDLSQGYTQAKQEQNLADAKTKQILNPEPVQAEFDFGDSHETSQQRIITRDVHSILSVIHNLNP